MEQEVNGTPATQETFPHFINPKVSLPRLQEPVISLSVLKLKHPVHPILFLTIHFNIVLFSRPGSSKWSLSLSFTHQNPTFISLRLLTCHPLTLMILAKNTNYGNSHYVVYCNPLLPSHSSPK